MIYDIHSVLFPINFHFEHVIDIQGLSAGFSCFIFFPLIKEFSREH